MTSFVKEKFTFDGPYMYYDGKFVARFKYKASACRPYATFLRNHFTVEEYFALADAHEAAQRDGSAYKDGYTGGAYKAAEARGWIMPHIRKWLRERGYEVSPAGQKQMIADQVARYFPKAA
jgi:hypothetical protein